MTLDFQHQRAMDDLLGAERAMREKNEQTIRQLRDLLAGIALLFDGTRYQDLTPRRSANPRLMDGGRLENLFQRSDPHDPRLEHARTA